MNQLSAQVLTAIDKGKKIRELVFQMHSRSGVGLRAFARKLGISPATLVIWKEGKGNPEANNLRKIALTSSRTLADLEDYLEGRLSLEEYLDGLPERSLPIEDVLKSLPYYRLEELGIILQSVSQQMVMKSQCEAKEWELIAFTENERLRLSSLVGRALKEAKLDWVVLNR